MQLLSNIDYFFLVKELNERLAGAYLNHVYLLENEAYRFKFHKKEAGEQNLVLELGAYCALQGEFAKASSESNAFVNVARQYLDNAKVKQVKQLNFDRILSIEFNNKTLIFEMFAEGNLLLLDETKGIIYTQEKAEYSARTIKRGEKYILPPSGKISLFEVKPTDLSSATGKVVPALCKIVNLPPFYVEEVCTRAKVYYSRKIEELKKEDLGAIAMHSAKLLEEFSPRVYYSEDGNAEFFSPFQLEKLKSFKFKTFKNFNECIAFYYANVKKESLAFSKAAKKREDKVKSLEARLKAQEESIAEFEKIERQSRAKAEWILQHEIQLEQLVKTALETPEKLEKLRKVQFKNNKLILEV